MVYQGVFFDLYGTLLIYGDMTSAWADWLSDLHRGLTKRGLSMSENELAQHCDGFFTDPAPSRQDGLTVFEGRMRKLGNGLGLTLNQHDLRDLAQSSVDAWQEYVSLDPETIPTLQALRTHKQLALVSNFEHPLHVHALLAELNLTGFFDGIVVSGDVGVEKPDPRIFDPVLAQAQLQPADALYVGDTLDDVRGARAAGLTPILIRRGNADQSPVASDYKADYDDLPDTSSTIEDSPIDEGAQVIHNLSELLEIAG
jgi:HAD superfamily hydrolase (TIGR01509 family)